MVNEITGFIMFRSNIYIYIYIAVISPDVIPLEFCTLELVDV
jgi:hypothetical protein